MARLMESAWEKSQAKRRRMRGLIESPLTQGRVVDKYIHRKSDQEISYSIPALQLIHKDIVF